jgi:uncharacterized membrane protein YcaP (DUF421 family)
MESVLRGAAVYLFLLLIFRISGKRTLAQTSPFELVLLLIISETTQQAMIGEDQSVTNALLLVTTLVSLSIILSLVKHRFPRVDRWMEGQPVRIMRDGVVLRDALEQSRVDEGDILAAARAQHGIDRLEDIRDAVVEKDGTLSIMPRRPS